MASRGSVVPDVEYVRLSSKGQFVLPKPVRDTMGVHEGDLIAIRMEGKHPILAKVETRETMAQFKRLGRELRKSVKRRLGYIPNEQQIVDLIRNVREEGGP